MKKYTVRGTPTVLILNADGQEIDRISGFNGEKDEYFQAFKDLAEGRNTLPKLLSESRNNPEDVEINFKLGKKYMSRGERDKAQSHFLKVLRLDKNNNYGFKTECTLNIGIHEALKGDNKRLEKFTLENTEQRFIYPAYYNLIRFYMWRKNKTKVMALYEEALRKDPMNARCMNNYAMFILSQELKEKFTEGYNLAKQAIAIDPDQAFNGYRSLVRYFTITKNLDGLIETYEEALLKYPDTETLINGYARVISRNQVAAKYDEGIILVQKFLEKQPESPRIWESLSWLYYRKGNLDQAVDAAKKAVDLKPRDNNLKLTLEKFQKEKRNIYKNK